MSSEDGVWRTISGRRVFIKEGQALSDAMKESGKFTASTAKDGKSGKFAFEKYRDALEEVSPRFDTKTMRGLKDGFEIDGEIFNDFHEAKDYMDKRGFEYLDRGNGKPGNMPGYNTAVYTSKTQVDHYNNVVETRKKLIEDYREHLNKNYESTYVRYGEIPESGKSYNFRDNFFEEGVSTFQAWKVGNKYVIDPVGGAFTYSGYSDSGKTLFEVSGNVVGFGSDNEPLLSGAVTTKTVNPRSVVDVKTHAYEGLKKKKK